MGYYSDVCIGMSKKNYKTMFDVIDNLKEENLKKELQNLVGMSVIYNPYIHGQDEPATYMIWHSIKWYNEYADVKWIENYLKEVLVNDFSFVRLGEEEGDIERYGCDKYYIPTNTAFDFNLFDWQIQDEIERHKDEYRDEMIKEEYHD